VDEEVVCVVFFLEAEGDFGALLLPLEVDGSAAFVPQRDRLAGDFLDFCEEAEEGLVTQSYLVERKQHSASGGFVCRVDCRQFSVFVHRVCN